MKLFIAAVALAFLLTSCVQPRPKGNAEGYGRTGDNKKKTEKKYSE